VPNLLQTGAGSPTGILVYEGDLLPERFRNQIIHADAGPNVIRAYQVEEQGAGYSATIDNLVKGKDQWFRPADVCVAPDGSLFIADWYDPGVGGHQAGDLQQGRIYRLAPEQRYERPSFDLSTPAGAVEALKNPNLSARYQAWQKLHAWGEEAEAVLAEMAQSENPRYRARALWLLSKLDKKGGQYVQQALQDADHNLRIAGIRMARQRSADIMPVLAQMKGDDSPQVRREVAIALRYLEGAAADRLWAELATQHDGQDRWYLEALGIGADEHAETRFQAWIDRVGDDWDTQAGRDIVWRLRSKETIPLLAQLIRDSEANSYRDRLRYFRAFDFRQDPTKEEALASLAVAQHPQQGDITLLALNHLSTRAVKQSPRLKQALKTSLEGVKGSKEYLELIKRYELKEYSADLLALALDRPTESVGGEAVRLQMDLAGTEAVEEIASRGDQDQKIALIQALKQANNGPAHDVLQAVIANQDQPLAVRKAAVMAFAGSWGGEDRLINMIRSGDLHASLDSTAVIALSTSMRNSLYQEASELLGIEAADDKKATMAPVKELLAIKGDIEHGETVFAQYCQNCHVVDGKGVDYGPGLSEIGDKLPKEALYTAILEPSRGISFGYEGYTIELKDGSQVMGYILSKNEDEVQMQLYGGLTNTYERSQIASIVEMDKSLMFDNLERAMSQQDLVDLVEYLAALRKDTRVSVK
jgi:putative heme-binding domain-containing protein